MEWQYHCGQYYRNIVIITIRFKHCSQIMLRREVHLATYSIIGHSKGYISSIGKNLWKTVTI